MTTISVDTTAFNAMCRDLKRISGLTFQQVIRVQAAALLSTAMKYTPSVKLFEATQTAQNKITRKYNTYAGGRAGSKDQYIGERVFESAKDVDPHISRSNGRFWWKEGSTFYHMGGSGTKRRWSNERWQAYQREEADRIADLEDAKKEVAQYVKRSRGLGKQSWLECGEEVGIDHLMRSVPAYVRKARPANGRVYKNGHGSERSNGKEFVLRMMNTSPIVTNRGQGAAILDRAIKARASAFATDMSKGVFNDLKTRASRYPGIFVQP